jgi:hypothetical protein
MLAVKDDAVSARLVSVKLATSVVLASATVSVALPRSNWPDSDIGFFPLFAGFPGAVTRRHRFSR